MIAPPVRPAAGAGAHRFIWNLQGPKPRSFAADATIAAIPHDTPLQPQGPTVPPGTYTVTLSADGVQQTRTLVLREDPRVSVSTGDLQAQYALAVEIGALTDKAYAAAERVRTRNAGLAQDLERVNGRLAQLLSAVENGDGAPTAVQRAALREYRAALEALVRQGQAGGSPR